MNSAVIFHILIAFGALQAIFLFAILVTSGSKLANRLFAFFLLIEGITLIERLLAETNLMVEFPHVLGVSYPLSFLKPPILLLLALGLTHSDFRLKVRHLLHGVPFVMILLMNIPFYVLSPGEKISYVSSFIEYVPTYDSFNFWFFLSFFLYIGVYLAHSCRVLVKYKKHIRNDRMANSYLKVLFLYSFLLSVQLLHFLIRPTGIVEFKLINEGSMLLMTFLIQSIAYNFLSNSKLLYDQSTRKLNQDLQSFSNYAEEIRRKIETEKVYLDDTLSLEAFAASLSMPKKQVSEVINQRFGTTFKSLLNHHRVEEAKSIMKHESSDRPKLVEIGLRSGFNNKVSFYRTFKKLTGKSPSDYFQSIAKRKK